MVTPNTVFNYGVDIGKGIQEIGGVLQVCGLDTLAEEIAHVGKEIEEGLYVTACTSPFSHVFIGSWR